ncbi:substrate-binding domain-containing protein [Bythopirellula goksoeyrii]|uniref:D-allose-binding periplasmic protein n=1 Tax=Bythopirellula goksoeyrii TaxID=1400387 RepID=A0A5B9QD32_9BACT|nr:substrate-binding domain-containing protein [Bythopirellula goksoeyrii]QEG35402.1 D-allose-binding periplasmic protein precursor [Bythopirellula goksoeyrii]
MKIERIALLAILVAASVGVMLYRTTVYDRPKTTVQPKFAVITGGSGPYWQAIASGVQSAARDLDAEVDVRMPDHDEDLEAQSKIITDLLGNQYDGVAVSPLDAEAQTRSINRLADHLFVVTIDSDAPLSARLGYVGASNFAAGTKCAELTKEAVPEGGMVAVLLANLSKSNMKDRKSGFAQNLIGGDDDEATSNDTYEIVDFLIDEGDSERCANQIRQVLKEHDDLACIVGLNSRHGPILLSVLKEENKLGDIKLITFDTPEETLTGVEQGHIFATIAQDPYQYGYEAIRLLTSYCNRPKEMLPPPGLESSMNIKIKVVRAEDVASFRADWQKRTQEKPIPAKPS